MTNFERFQNEITEIIYNKKSLIAREKNTGRFACCGDISCAHCQFLHGNCVVNMFEWMLEEYQEPVPKLTTKERAFCEIIKNGYIARNEKGRLFFYSEKPVQNISGWRALNWTEVNRDYFQFITWESSKAWSINELLALEVEE